MGPAVTDDTSGWTAFFVREEDQVGIYDIYDNQDEWVAQCRFDRRRAKDVYVLFARDSDKSQPLKEIKGRDEWREWLVAHQGNL
jgi:hypothetical protein